MDRKLSPVQQEVAECLDSNLLLFSGAGCGKTFTLAQRIRNILESERAKPEEILCITFTTKAAQEMKEDLKATLGEMAQSVVVSTIHGFAYQVLREECLRNPEKNTIPGICDDTDEYELMKNLLVEHFFFSSKSSIFNEDKTNRIGQFISTLKHEREIQNLYTENEAEDFRRIYEFLYQKDQRAFLNLHCGDENFREFMKAHVGEAMQAYCERLTRLNLVDFDDLICKTHRLFRSPERLKPRRERFRFLMIDEMQDTSLLEYSMLRKLFAGNNVMMCGDYFQTIYEWRGSKPREIIAAFRKEFHPQEFSFCENYRSTRLLTQAGFAFLRQTFPSESETYGRTEMGCQSTADGEKIRTVCLHDPAEEAKWIVRYLVAHPEAWGAQTCILARSNPYLNKLAAELQKAVQGQAFAGENLHFLAVAQKAGLYKKKVFKDILAFFRLMINSEDERSLLRITDSYVNRGRRLSQLVDQAGALGLSLSTVLWDAGYRYGDPYAPLIQAAQEGKLVIYDTETTGLDLDHDQIIQLSAIRLDANGGIAEVLDQLVIPSVPISKEAENTHHITLEGILARGGCERRAALQGFSKFVRGGVLVGHNSLQFDAPLLRRELSDCGLPPLEVQCEYDTMVIAKQLYPKSANYKLETLCERFSIVNETAHDALSDITATGKVLWQMLQTGLIPTQAERRELAAELLSGFERLHAFLNELKRDYFEKGLLPEMAECIIEKCRMRAKFHEPPDLRAMNELTEMLKKLDPAKPESELRNLLQNLSLTGSPIGTLLKGSRCIPLVTVHQSKGCEFDTVILAGADDDDFPSVLSVKEGKLAEEARAFYVAITRAKKRLIITYPKTKTNGYGQVTYPKPSRFLKRLPPESVCTDSE